MSLSCSVWSIFNWQMIKIFTNLNCNVSRSVFVTKRSFVFHWSRHWKLFTGDSPACLNYTTKFYTPILIEESFCYTAVSCLVRNSLFASPSNQLKVLPDSQQVLSLRIQIESVTFFKNFEILCHLKQGFRTLLPFTRTF